MCHDSGGHPERRSPAQITDSFLKINLKKKKGKKKVDGEIILTNLIDLYTFLNDILYLSQ